MITGVVDSDEGRIRLKVKGPRGRERVIEAVVDTGYTGSLSLPPKLVAALALSWRTSDRGILADGSEILFDVYEAMAMWDRKARRVLIHEADIDPLVGMELLRGYELKMQIRRQGKSRQSAFPARAYRNLRAFAVSQCSDLIPHHPQEPASLGRRRATASPRA